MKESQIYNTHIHAFENEAVPRRLFGGAARFFYKSEKIRGFIRFLHQINPLKDDDVFDRMARYAGLGSRTTKEILEHIFEYYPENTTFAVLAMDMSFMSAGKTTQPYYKQLENLAKETENTTQTILPFICVDPRRGKKKKNLRIDELGTEKDSLLDFVKYWLEEKKFHGIKLYPPLGYFPWDKDLLPIYKYAMQNKIPIIAHCSPGIINSKKCKRKLRKQILKHKDLLVQHGILKQNENLRKKSRKELCAVFTHPKNYEIVMEKMEIPTKQEEKDQESKNLHICLAHFGGNSEVDLYLNPEPGQDVMHNWFFYIRELMAKYSAIYTDISFTWGEEKYDPLLKVILLENNKIKNQILFGSDYYMNQIGFSERNFGLRIRGYLGEEKFTLIAHDNPKQFLFLSS